MKQIVLLFAAISLSVVFLANLDGALPQNTGAPGDLTCGRAPCHNIPNNVGDAQISITFNNGDSTYLADSIYPVTVTIQNPMTFRNGFQILALNQLNQNTGTWQLIEPDKMKIIPGIGFPSRKYVTHQAPGNMQTEWTMNWKAPSSNAGKVTFYAAVLSANNNGMNTGDEVYTTKIDVNYADVAAVGVLAEEAYKVYPIPATTGIWVETPVGKETLHFSLYDAGSKLVKEQTGNSKNLDFIETENLPHGIYYLLIESSGKRAAKKVIVQ